MVVFNYFVYFLVAFFSFGVGRVTGGRRREEKKRRREEEKKRRREEEKKKKKMKMMTVIDTAVIITQVFTIWYRYYFVLPP